MTTNTEMLVGLTLSLGHYNNSSACIMTFLSPFSHSVMWSPSGLSLFHTGNVFHSGVLVWFLAQQFSILAAHWDYLWNPSPTSWASVPRVGLGLVTKHTNPNYTGDSNETHCQSTHSKVRDSIKTSWIQACHEPDNSTSEMSLLPCFQFPNFWFFSCIS